jgi:hypothetical protein
MQAKALTPQTQEQQLQTIVGHTPGMESPTFASSELVRTIIYNPYSLDSLFCAAILERHFHRNRVRAASVVELLGRYEHERYILLGLPTKGTLMDIMFGRAKSSLAVQTLNADANLPTDEIGIGPTMLTNLSEEFGIRTERYEKLMYHAQRFFRKDNLSVESLAYVYKNAKLAFQALQPGAEFPFTPSEATQADQDDYMREFKKLRLSMTHVAITPALDGHTRVHVVSGSMEPIAALLSTRLFKLRGLSYFNRQGNINGDIVFTDLHKPVMNDPKGLTAVVTC